MHGGAGNDTLIGGLGKDVLFGDAGSDTFDFNTKAESAVGAKQDIIADFVHDQDHINLRDIDANSRTQPNDNFKFLGAKAFSKHAGELHYVKKAGFLMVEGDSDGNGTAVPSLGKS
jgi:serralysin